MSAPDHADGLGLAARRLGDRGARGAAADGEALEEAGGQIGGAQRHDLLVRVDLAIVLEGEGARERRRVRERDERHAERGQREAAHLAGDEGGQRRGRESPVGTGPTTATPWATSPKAATARLAPTTAMRTAGTFGRERPEAEEQDEAGDPDGQGARRSSCRRATPSDELLEPSRGALRGDAEAEELGQLAHDHDYGHPVEVADAQRLGEQFRDHAEVGESGDRADHAHDHRHRRRQGDGPGGVASGADERQDRRQDQRRQSGIGAEDQDARRAEDRVGEQRHDGRIEAGHRGQPGELGVGHALRDEEGRDREAGDEVAAQVGATVPAKCGQPRQPT